MLVGGERNRFRVSSGRKSKPKPRIEREKGVDVFFLSRAKKSSSLVRPIALSSIPPLPSFVARPIFLLEFWGRRAAMSPKNTKNGKRERRGVLFRGQWGGREEEGDGWLRNVSLAVLCSGGGLRFSSPSSASSLPRSFSISLSYLCPRKVKKREPRRKNGKLKPRWTKGERAALKGYSRCWK